MNTIEMSAWKGQAEGDGDGGNLRDSRALRHWSHLKIDFVSILTLHFQVQMLGSSSCLRCISFVVRRGLLLLLFIRHGVGNARV